jgi:hypothetical protein
MVGRIIFDLSHALDEDKQEIRERGFALLGLVLNALIQDMHGREAQHGEQHGTWPADAQQDGANLLRIIDHVAERLHDATA